MTKEKAIVLFSGGLDSRLAIKIMQKDYRVIALFFKLPFSKNVEPEIKKFAKQQKLELKTFDCTEGRLFQEYINIIKKPKHGRGACINPCIDCRIFILRKAKQFADRQKIKLLATGEVIGERPMSQTKKAMDLIEKESGLKGRLIRPLSDKKFPHKISGRRRDKQIFLAKKFKIKNPGVGGGCLLCEPLYCKKLKEIINKKSLKSRDIELLKIGRHFESSQVILGRNREENNILEKEQGIKLIPLQPGPTALIKDKKYINKAKTLIRKYSKHKIKEFKVKK